MSTLNRGDNWNATMSQEPGTTSTYTMNTAGTFLDKNIALTVQANGYNVVDKTADGLCPQLPDEDEINKFLRQDGTWAMPEHIITSKVFDDVWAGPLDKTTAEAKAMNSKASGTQDGSTWQGQYRIYLGKIRITGIDKTNTTTAGRTWDSPWHIRFRVSARMFYRDASGNKIYHNNGKAHYDWNIYGSGTTYTYSDFNNRYDWTPTYYHFVNRPQASYMKSTSDSPVLWGINFYSTNSTNSNRSYYKREFTVDVIECDGCEFEFLDDWECVRNYHKKNTTLFPRGAATYYYGYLTNNGSNTDVDGTGFNDYDAVNNGLRESGDDNSTQEFYHYSPIKAGGQGIHGYAIVGELADGTYASFTTNNGTSSASVIKVANTADEFLYGGHTLYYMSNNNIAAGANASVASYWNYYAFDTRYLSNYYGTSASSNPSLAFGWSGNGTTATFSYAWIKVEFTADRMRYKVKSLLLNDRDRAALGEGYYMLIGSNYNSTSEYYRIATLQEPRIYHIDVNGKLSVPTLGFMRQHSVPIPERQAPLYANGTYNDLETHSKTIFGAINELNSVIDDKSDVADPKTWKIEVGDLVVNNPNRESQVSVRNNAGNIWLYSQEQPSGTRGNMGLYAYTSLDVSRSILSVNAVGDVSYGAGSVTGNLNVTDTLSAQAIHATRIYAWDLESSNTEITGTKFLKIANIVINRTYLDSLMVFTLIGRSFSQPTKVYVRFASAGHSDPAVAQFQYSGYQAGALHLVKVGSGNWDLYMEVPRWYPMSVTNLEMNCIASPIVNPRDELVDSITPTNTATRLTPT